MESLTADLLWARLGVRWVRWSGPHLKKQNAFIPPRLRSGLGKFARRLMCPEAMWQKPCGNCPHRATCGWMELFPGSAGDEGRVAPWVLHTQGQDIYTLHAGPSTEAFAGFWLALEAVLSQELQVDRGNAKRGPRWLGAEIVDPRCDQGLAPLTWGDRDIPMGPAPHPLEPGSTLRFSVPLELKMEDRSAPPAMADWLRLGRNRVARLARQVGRPIWPVEDSRWRQLSDSATMAHWTWNHAERGTSWGSVPKHHFELSSGWRGEVRIEEIPAPWRGWAALLPLVGVGSHIPFGCGVGERQAAEPRKFAPPPSPQDNVQKLVLQWRSGIA